MDRGVWWAAVHRAANRTRLKRLSMHTHTHRREREGVKRQAEGQSEQKRYKTV